MAVTWRGMGWGGPVRSPHRPAVASPTDLGRQAGPGGPLRRGADPGCYRTHWPTVRPVASVPLSSSSIALPKQARVPRTDVWLRSGATEPVDPSTLTGPCSWEPVTFTQPVVPVSLVGPDTCTSLS